SAPRTEEQRRNRNQEASSNGRDRAASWCGDRRWPKLTPRARGDLAQVERLVQRLLVDPVLARDLAQRAAARGGVLDDLGRLVVADVRIQRGRHRERALRGGLQARQVRLDVVDALLGQQRRCVREQLDRLQQVARDQRDPDVELELAL